MIKTLYDLPTLIFWLLSLIRSNPGSTAKQKAACARYREVFRRVSFWIRLCQAGGLLSKNWPLAPGPLALDWLSWPVARQWRYLLRVWMDIPADPYRRKVRVQLLQNLAGGAVKNWHRKTPEELAGLRYFGLWSSSDLTLLGKVVLVERMHDLPEPVYSPWQLYDQELIVNYPSDWRLLWELEVFLVPYRPGHYLLTSAALRRAAQRGDFRRLAALLEQASGAPIPVTLQQRLAHTPTARVLPGPVIEFSSPEELAALRAFPAFRPRLEHLLSPRAVALDPSDRTLLYRFEMMGLLADTSWHVSPGKAPAKSLSFNEATPSQADRVYLAGLIRAAEALRFPVSPPDGLLQQLEADLEEFAVRAIERQTQKIVENLSPPRWAAPEPDFPPHPPGALLETLREAILYEETLEVSYRGPGRPAAEIRRLSPLAIEERGGRTYLLAYCHTRRGNRTFRLDRLTLTGNP